MRVVDHSSERLVGDAWRDRFWRMVGDVVTDDVTAEFLRAQPEDVVSDDLGWLDEIVLRVTGCAVDMKELVGARLAREYRAFRAAHGRRGSSRQASPGTHVRRSSLAS